MAAHVVDPQTLSNFNDVRALHYSLELTADFDKKVRTKILDLIRWP
jgi:hypothetical protein